MVSDSTRCYRTNERTDLVLNPFVPKSSTLCGPRITGFLAGFAGSVVPSVYRGNPILRHRQQFTGIIGKLRYFYTSPFAGDSHGIRPEVVERKEASWRKMYATQPPVAYPPSYDSFTSFYTPVDAHKMKVAGGVTLGGLQAAVDRAHAKTGRSSIIRFEAGTVRLMLPESD